MNLNQIIPQLPFLLAILGVFITYGVMVRREILSGAKIWQGGLVMGLIAVTLAALNDRLNLHLPPELEKSYYYLFNPAVMAFCSAFCVVTAYRMQNVTDIATWQLGDTKIILRICLAAKMPDADALILPTGVRLEMRHGIPAQVRNAGGEAIETAARKFAPVGIGKIIITMAGTLAVGKIYHVAVYEAGKAIKADVMRRFMGEALIAARKERAESVCIPLGAYPGMTTAGATTAICEAMLKQHKAFGEIVLCIFEARDDREIAAAARKVFGEESKTTGANIAVDKKDVVAKNRAKLG